MTLHDLTEALEDSAVLADLARRAGITMAQARTVAAALANLPLPQVIRMCSTAHADAIRRANRAARKR